MQAQPVWQSLFDPQGNWHFCACRLHLAPMHSASDLQGVANALGVGLPAGAPVGAVPC